jgi:hypothetical protein
MSLTDGVSLIGAARNKHWSYESNDMKTQPSPKRNKAILSLICGMVALTFTGCATSGGKPTYTRTLSPEAQIVSGDKVTVEVAAGPQVAIANYEKQRFGEKIEAAIRGRAPQGSRGGRAYRVVVTLVKYEKGSAIARAMLAGLGQMHIEAKVNVYAMPGRKLMAEFTMDKTFSWGGLYGATTNIETVEEEFGKSLADAVCPPKPR